MATNGESGADNVAGGLPDSLWGKLVYFWEKQSGIVGLIELYLVGILWGVGTIIAKLFFFAGFNALQVAFIRAFVGAIGLFALIVILKKLDSLKPRKDLWLLIMNGVSYAFMYFAFLLAIKISVAHGTILLIAAPIFVAILSPIFLEENLHRNTIYAVIFTVIGIAFLILSSVSHEGSISATKMLFSDLMGISAGFFAAFYIMSGRKLKRSYEPLSISFWSMAVASILFAIPFIFSKFPKTETLLRGDLIFWALFMGFVINGLGTYLNMDGVRKVIAQRAVIIQMILDPLVSILLAWVFFNEVPHLGVFIGGIFMVIGLFIATKEEAAVHLEVEKLNIDPDAKRILLAIKQLGSASVYRIAEETGLPDEVISEKIKFLLEKGYLVKREDVGRYWEKIYEEEKALIDKTKEKLDPEVLEKIVKELANAQVVFVGEKTVGLNFSRIIPSYLKSAGVVSVAVPITNHEAMTSVLRSMKKGDVLLITDYVFHEKSLDVMIAYAKRLGVKTIAIADGFTIKSVDGKVDLILEVETKKLGLPISLVPLLATIDAIVIGVAIHKRKLIQKVAADTHEGKL